MIANVNSGIVSLPSSYSVNETVKRLNQLLTARGVRVFSVIDHSGEAAAAGINMPNTKLLIFGAPRAGTPIMLATPSTALDLPLKILVAEDSSGGVWLSYSSPAYLRDRHSIPAELMAPLASVETLARLAASASEIP